MRVSPEWLKGYLAKSGKALEVPPPKQEETCEYRSKWEAQFAYELSLLAQLDDHPDEILDWWYEPIKLKLYTKTVTKKGKKTTRGVYYVPDFMILHTDGLMELVEIKGYERKAGEIKYFTAVEKYPGFHWRKIGKESGKWVTIHEKRREI